MTVTVTKVAGYGVTGSPAGVTVSKLVAYAVMQPGAEEGVTPPVRRADCYAQRVRNLS